MALDIANQNFILEVFDKITGRPLRCGRVTGVLYTLIRTVEMYERGHLLVGLRPADPDIILPDNKEWFYVSAKTAHNKATSHLPSLACRLADPHCLGYTRVELRSALPGV